MLNLQEILNVIKDVDGISDYRIIENDKNSYELFFVHGKAETVRRADSLERTLSVYINHDGKRGMNSFILSAALDAEGLKAKIEFAVKQAELVFDEAYVLPDNETCNVELESNIASDAPEAVAAKIAETVYGANPYEDCDINALEIFIVKEAMRVINSRGIDKKQVRHSVHIEAIPTCNGKDTSVELFEAYDMSELDIEWLSAEIKARIDDVRARLVAKKPENKLNCPIVLNAYELEKLFKAICSDANYIRAYTHTNLRSVGDVLQTSKDCDKLNVTMRGAVKGSATSSRFDNDGTTLVDREIIRDGTVIAGYGPHRYATYLGKTPTGMLECIDVRAGVKSAEELLSAPHLELVFMSGLQVDPLSDYIGGEVRLAYYFDGKKRVPVTGIAMSGKLSDALNTLRLSSERAISGCYSGPAKAVISGMNIF